MRNKAAARFTSRLIVGCIASIVLGNWIDQRLSTTPWIMFILLLYVIVGSFYLLIKETGEKDGE
ncbi:MAG: AtpZ/AtpI family protein [Erysipelotrichia bacterium]|nr:AtpZ/AtpI family protein [Erysipelotrichia bacterium]